MGSKHLTPEEVSAMRELRKHGHSIAKIADASGRSEGAVRRALGSPTETRRHYTPGDVETGLAMFDRGEPIEAIARALGRTPGAAKEALRTWRNARDLTGRTMAAGVGLEAVRPPPPPVPASGAFAVLVVALADGTRVAQVNLSAEELGPMLARIYKAQP